MHIYDDNADSPINCISFYFLNTEKPQKTKNDNKNIVINNK